MPMTLGEALQALDEDELVKSALPGEMMRVFEHYKRDEWERYCSRGVATGTSRSTWTSSLSAVARVDALAARLIAAGATPGAAVAVSDRDGPVWARSLRPCGCRPRRGRSTAGTLFQIGSISKSFTAICLLRLWERGRLDLDAEVRSLLPWFPFAGITVHHLLSHTGGIVCSLGDPPSPAWEVLSLAQTARAPAGEHFWYSNVGYQALGLMLERLTGEPFADTYRREIIEPLGLAETEPLLTNALRARMAVGHEPLDRDRGRGGSATRSSRRRGSSTAAPTAACARRSADLAAYGLAVPERRRGRALRRRARPDGHAGRGGSRRRLAGTGTASHCARWRGGAGSATAGA